jgi:hypothetical protein
MQSSEKDIDVKQIVQAALSIAAKRRETLLQLKQALEAEDVAKAIKLAKELCGLS